MIKKYQYGGPGYFLGGVTAKDLDEGTKKVARGFNWLMGKVGDAFNTVVTAGASSDFGQTSPFAQMDRKAVAKGREQVRQKAKKAIEENAVYVSPSSHIAAWTQGSWNPKVGAQFLASDPRLQALGVVGDLTALKYTPKTVKVGKNLLQIQKKRSVISKVNKELKKGIKENSVLESYNEVPANKDIGTVYDYLDFLDNIYPNSKLNATFYHGGPKGITQFKTAKELGSTNKGINSGTKDYGIYLADDKSLAQYYAGTNKKANRHLYNVRVNVQNPMRYETNNWYMDKMSTTGDLRFRPGEITQKWYDKLGLKDYDGIYHTKSKNAFDNGELVMLDGDNIHIMGTPKESQMFRNWKQNPQYSSKPLQEEIPLTPEQYERSFLNYAKAAKPGLFFAGLVSTPPALIWYNNYQKSKKANARKWKHEGGGELIKKSQQGSQLPTAEDVIKRYKNESYSRDIKSDYRNGYNTGYVDIQKITTDKPFHKQGTIQREIHYIMGSPIDTIFTETPPSFLPIKRISRSAQRFGPWKNNEYVGNKNEYEKLKERWGKAKEEAEKTIIRKDGGTLKAQYGAPLNLSTEDIQGGLQYITQGLGKVWNIMNAPVVNVQPSTTASLPNGSQIEIPGTQTGIVDDSFGKGGGGKKVGKKLLQSVAKSKDKGLTVTKKVDSSVRHGLVNVDQDLRHFGGGNRRMDPEELIKEMDKHAEFRDIAKHLSKRFGNLKKDNPQSMKDFKALKNKYEDMFNDFLHNGIKKHQEGAKLTFGQKLGNFANSDLGKSVISNGLSFLSNKLFNKSASSNQEIAQAAQEKEQSTIDPIQVAQMIEIAKNQYADPDNPNANGGDIFNSYIKNQITAPILARQQEEHKKRLAAIEQQKNQAKSSAVGTFFNTLAQGGIEYLQNKYGTTEKADS